jgi:HIRAN domain
MIGRTVTLEKSSNSEVAVCLDGTVVGHLEVSVGNQVALAIDRGHSFTAVIINAYPIYNDSFKQTSSHIDLKVEYLLKKGQPPIEAPTCWRAVPVESSHAANSFFTKIAGVTFEGRQRIVARCSVSERLLLVRNPTDRYDKGAIKVMRLNGEQLGFIPAHVSRGGDPTGLAFRMDRGDNFQCRIKDLTGGGEGRSLGVNIEVTECEFDDVLSTGTTSLSAVPHQNTFEGEPLPSRGLGWLFFAAAAVLLLIVVLIRNSS